MRLLTHKEHELLQVAAKHTQERGRLPTSTELHGTDHFGRGRYLWTLRDLEEEGFVERAGKTWDTGRVTQAGLDYLATWPLPAARQGRALEKIDHGISLDGGTRYKKRLYPLAQVKILASGAQSVKLGGTATKGRHQGLPLVGITLEEGRTCPASCALRSRCYGGNMPLAKRIKWEGLGTTLGIAGAIKRERPSLIRMHTLGDFPDMRYVTETYAAVLKAGSSAFGYTHHGPETPIGARIRDLAEENWNRYSIRTSYLHGTRPPIVERSAVIVERKEQAAEHNAVVCPEQMGQAKSCASCGYCWNTERPVAFVFHSNLPRQP